MNQASERIKILLVDDRPENLLSLATVLESPGYELLTASTGSEALRCVLNHDFALILLDVQMPDIDGFETASLIKQRERSKNIPIIFVTALSRDEPFVFKGYKAGAVDYILKPFNPDILRSKVEVFADLYRKNRQIQVQSDLLRKADRIKQDQTIARLEVESLRREQVSNERYRNLVDGINHGLVWVADAKTLQFHFQNSTQLERLVGCSADVIENEPDFWLNHVHPDDRAQVRAELERAAITGDGLSLEHRFVKPSGEVVWFHTGIQPAHKNGNHTRPGNAEPQVELHGLSVDVTHLKNAEEVARSATRMRDDFLSIASHELKTPLTPLKLQLQTFKRLIAKDASPELIKQKVGQLIEVSEKQIERLIRLVEELLDVARLNNGKMILEYEPIRLDDLIKDVVERFKEDLTRAKCTVQLNLESDLVGSWDRLRIEQIFINLLTNSTKYGEGKPIDVSCFSKNGLAHLKVRDNGIGISKIDQERIFKRFERVTTASHYGGLGLGLYIVKQIVEAHGGTISVESEIGLGSVFTVVLPLAVEDHSKTDAH